MSIAALILVSVFSVNAPGPVTQVTVLPDMASCKIVLETAMEGASIAYRGNATAIAGSAVLTQEDGWTILRSPMRRIIAQGRCKDSGESATGVSRKGSVGKESSLLARSAQGKLKIDNIAEEAVIPLIRSRVDRSQPARPMAMGSLSTTPSDL